MHGALAAATGWDPLGTLRATEQVYRFGIAGERPYWFWLAGSPTAFLLMLGLPVAWFALRALAAGEDTALAVLGRDRRGGGGGLHQGRGGADLALPRPARPASPPRPSLPPRHLRPVLALLGAQALAWELAWNTVW